MSKLGDDQRRNEYELEHTYCTIQFPSRFLRGTVASGCVAPGALSASMVVTIRGRFFVLDVFRPESSFRCIVRSIEMLDRYDARVSGPLEKLSAAVAALRTLLIPVLLLVKERGRSLSREWKAPFLLTTLSSLALVVRVCEVDATDVPASPKLEGDRLKADMNLRPVGELGTLAGCVG